MEGIGQRIIAYAAVFGIYIALAIAAIIASRQSKYAGLIFSLLTLGLFFIVVQVSYTSITQDFISGAIAGLCVGIGGVLALAAYKGRARRSKVTPDRLPMNPRG